MKAYMISSISTLEELMKVDFYNLIVEQGWEEGAVIALPNISIDTLRALQPQFRSFSNGDNLDLSIIFPNTSVRWEHGWDDGNRIFVQIFSADTLKAMDGNFEEFMKTVFEEINR